MLLQYVQCLLQPMGLYPQAIATSLLRQMPWRSMQSTVYPRPS